MPSRISQNEFFLRSLPSRSNEKSPSLSLLSFRHALRADLELWPQILERVDAHPTAQSQIPADVVLGSSIFRFRPSRIIRTRQRSGRFSKREVRSLASFPEISSEPLPIHFHLPEPFLAVLKLGAQKTSGPVFIPYSRQRQPLRARADRP